ncbi:sporulation-specific diadenylate cyclase CdaS [Peribacillus kribbensis]|uniref:sporulation-specific diadenylate cyclase CdaS n=1 Tax=Peribacillus kribbensis TaxID=356658 RepID=UPI00040F2846|nr:sporulation-specific diadenylate cyclase CdaS [Peribacillus kribbensis]
MDQINCDFSPMKEEIIKGIEHIMAELQGSIKILGNEHQCLLGRLEHIRKDFLQIEYSAATFYLNCYLSAFTDKFKELSISLQYLSKHRFGALIVIERSDPLEGLIQKGTPVGAELSSVLIETIFYPGNPLHDGAVIVQGNQIVSAANVLPLTQQAVTEKKLGTRHRAALGVTEMCDALVLIVSEETGKVSFALNGKLFPISDVQSLLHVER